MWKSEFATGLRDSTSNLYQEQRKSLSPLQSHGEEEELGILFWDQGKHNQKVPPILPGKRGFWNTIRRTENCPRQEVYHFPPRYVSSGCSVHRIIPRDAVGYESSLQSSGNYSVLLLPFPHLPFLEKLQEKGL